MIRLQLKKLVTLYPRRTTFNPRANLQPGPSTSAAALPRSGFVFAVAGVAKIR
jgi:hypothetical protein